MLDYLLVGAGLAGLTAAQKLAAANKSVMVLEKSRGPGGRAATRRLEGNRVDHGAQYITARDKRFQKQLDEWLAQGKAFVWTYGFHRLTADGLKPATLGHPRYAFKNGMNEIGKLLANDLVIQYETKVKTIKAKGGTWLITTEAGETFEGKNVIVNTPAEQALTLLEPKPQILEETLGRVYLSPCFALILGYPLDLAPDWQGIVLETHSSLAWIAHDSSKRKNPSHTVVILHSTADFAQKHFDDDPKELAHLMHNELIKLDEQFSEPLFQSWHRWKYAQVISGFKERFLSYEDSLFFCGDWCGGEKLESAYLSGLELANHLLGPKT